MENSVQVKEFFHMHQDACLQEMRRSKETKDKIVFFIGTLFITMLFGSGVLIYKSYQLKPGDGITQSTLDKLYAVQYLLMHLFFLLLYLYYTYNNVQEKIYMVELQCCQVRIQSLSEEYAQNIKVPFALIKRFYCDGRKVEGIKPRAFKDVSNFLMIAVYTVFSAIPLIFEKDFILVDSLSQSTIFKLKTSWILIWILGIGILLLIISTGKASIRKVKKHLLANWSIGEDNQFGI